MSTDNKLWLQSGPTENLAAQLAQLIQQPNCLMVPGVYDPLSALLAKKSGFQSLYLSGAALTASLGLPDLGILTMEELISRTRAIVRSTKLPLIVDGDTGYGEAINVMRLVRELEDAGAAAVQIEDQVLPKKCGHLNGKSLVSEQEMSEKVAAAKQARNNLLIIARTDACASEGLDKAIQRAQSYVAAGADIIFPEALTSTDDFKAFSQALDVPVLGNMTEFGRTPQMSQQDFTNLGVDLAIWPVSCLRIAAKAMDNFYQSLAQDGSAKSSIEKMQTRAELYELINYFEYEALDKSIQQTVLTDTMK